MYIKHLKPHIPAGFQHLPVGSTAVKLTVPTNARYAMVRVMDDNIRFRDDGPTASSATGYPLREKEEIEIISREQLAAFNAISTGGTASLAVRYYEI